MVRRAGYACALTVDLGFNSRVTDLFRLRRIAIDDDDDKYGVVVKACGLWALLKRSARAPAHGYVEDAGGCPR